MVVSKTPRARNNKALPPFDKYKYYLASVQSPEEDMKFLEKVYRDARGAKASAKVMREDFCGTFANSKAWVERAADKIAHGVDLDPEPLSWGREHHLAAMKPAQQARLHLHKSDVMGRQMPVVDIISAMNFSYFIFKEREELKRYFKNCLRTLNKDGVLLLDCFGGSKCFEPIEEETEFDDFKYYWDQDNFDPLTNAATFHIHFKRPGEAKRLNCFTYDWRMWSVPELKDILLDAGFKKVNLYWEGVDENGEGDGNFQVSEKGDDCESWIVYLAALK